MLNTQGVPSVEGIQSLFFTRNLGMDVVSDLLTFAICRARPQPNPSECLSQTLPHSTFIEGIYIYIHTPLYILREDVTCTPRPADLYSISVRNHVRS